MENERILENWIKSISTYPKYSFKEAKDLYKQIQNTKVEYEKHELREKLITGTLYLLNNYIKKNILVHFNNSKFDINDIINNAVEEWIKIIDSSALLNANSFNSLVKLAFKKNNLIIKNERLKTNNSNNIVYEDLSEKIVNDLYNKDLVEQIMKACNFNERTLYIINERLGLIDGKEKTLEYIAKKLNISKENIRRIEGKALKTMRNQAKILRDKESESKYNLTIEDNVIFKRNVFNDIININDEKINTCYDKKINTYYYYIASGRSIVANILGLKEEGSYNDIPLSIEHLRKRFKEIDIDTLNYIYNKTIECKNEYKKKILYYIIKNYNYTDIELYIIKELLGLIDGISKSRDYISRILNLPINKINNYYYEVLHIIVLRKENKKNKSIK